MKEKMILVEKLNEEKKLISKEVPENLLSIYLGIGWKRHEIKSEKKVEVKSEPIKEKIEEVKLEEKKFESHKK